ncbi:MAG: toprim domain-containing protein [Butyricicoccus sp.]
MSYDADGAGQAAAQRAIDILKKCDLQVKVLRIPGAKDPDEFIKARGADAFRNLIERSEDHNAFRIEQIAAKYDLEDDEARVLFLRDAARMLAGIESTIEREVYAGRAAKMAGVTAEAMNVEVRRELGIQRKRRRPPNGVRYALGRTGAAEGQVAGVYRHEIRQGRGECA